MQVKIIRASNTWTLESDINAFLKTKKDNEIIDIKYQGVGNHAPYSSNQPSAMIIMK